MKVVVVGRGRVGSALTRVLRTARHVEVTSLGRKLSHAPLQRAEIIVLAVSDDAIESVARGIAPHIQPTAIVLHCAGARSVDALHTCAKRGAATGVMHPLVSFASPTKPPPLRGVTFSVQGSPHAVRAARKLAQACGAKAVSVRLHDSAYHAAAALVANGTASLAFTAVGVLRELGLSKNDAYRAVAGLLRSVASNVEQVGVPDALTGPVRRGDVATVADHRRALRQLRSSALASYDALVPVIVRCAQATGLPARKAGAILRTLKKH